MLKAKYSVILVVAGLASFSATASEVELEKKLMSRCIASLDIIKNKDLQAFNELMPNAPSEGEIKHNKKYLERKYQEWYVRAGKILKIKEKKIEFMEPRVEMKEQYNAVREARTSLRVESEKVNSNTSCRFVKTPKGWFQSKLP
jgi:hypothetical protein